MGSSIANLCIGCTLYHHSHSLNSFCSLVVQCTGHISCKSLLLKPHHAASSFKLELFTSSGSITWPLVSVANANAGGSKDFVPDCGVMVKLSPGWHGQSRAASRGRKPGITHDGGSSLGVLNLREASRKVAYRAGVNEPCPPISVAAHIGPHQHARPHESIHVQDSGSLELNS